MIKIDFGIRGLLNKNYITRHGIAYYKLLFKKFPEASKGRQAMSIALGFPLELKGKILLLKVLHSLTTEPPVMQPS